MEAIMETSLSAPRTKRLGRAFLYALTAVLFIACAGRAGRPAPGDAIAPREELALPEMEKRADRAMSKSVAAPAPAQGSVAAGTAIVAADQGAQGFNTEEYNRINENEFKDVTQNPLSTFSIDVDKAAYGNLRRFLMDSQLPPPDAVRIEELVNYFPYPYPDPDAQSKHPFSITTELVTSPWNPEASLLLIGIQGKRLDYKNLKPSNLVFLIDTSGSMGDENKLPLLQKSLGMLVKGLSQRDKIAIVAYAGSAGLVLDSTPASEQKAILDSLNKLSSGGSTAGAEGITLAYEVAKRNYIPGGNNRVILCTDGDFNVGTSSTSDLTRMMDERRKEDVYLTICGFGMGNYKDGRMEEISKAGNGNYFYIDSIKEAEKVFVKEMRANMFTIAKDVKVQVEFNPAVVKAYRLVGYENRLLAAEDFKDDTKDAGELGAGHSVTALYEILPADSKAAAVKAEDLKYQAIALTPAAASGEMATVKFRYKPLGSDVSVPIDAPIGYRPGTVQASSETMRWVSAVAEFGMILRNSKFKGGADWASVAELAKGAKGADEEGYRAEFLDMVQRAKLLSGK
jgi:Ca-activated chloride channel homolog